jgi:hypothetical protein
LKEVFQHYLRSGTDEVAALEAIEHHCSETTDIEVCRQIIQILYNLELISEDAVLYWFSKKLSNTLIKQKMARFVKWLEEASEEEASED